MTEALAGAQGGLTARGYRFHLLGPLEVHRLGMPVALGGRQQRAVLARLLVEPNTLVSIERLADALWRDAVPDGAVTTIQTYVSHLREALEPDVPRTGRRHVVVTETGGYRLAVDEADIDVVAFERAAAAGRAELNQAAHATASERLAAALALWRGPVLADLADYEFAREAATRLEIIRIDALEDRIDADLALGRHRDVVAELDGLVAAHPLRERLQGQLMLARYRCGQQGEALAQFQQLRQLLAEELGIDPSRDVQRLHEAILRQDAALDRPPPRVRLVASVGPSQPVTEAGPDDVRLPVATGSGRPRSRVGTVALVVVAAVLAVSTVSSDSARRDRPAALSELPANTIGRIDPDGRLAAAVPMDQSPTALAAGGHWLWAAHVGAATVARIDARDGVVRQTIDVGRGPDALAVLGESVWVANGGDGTISRINAATNRVVQTVRVGNIPSALAAGAGALWVANSGDDTIQRIDAVSGAVGRPVDVGGRPAGVAVSDRTVWVANSQDGTVSRIDAVTGQAASPVRVGAGPTGLAVTADSVWVANSLELTVSRIDRHSGSVVDTIVVGDGPHSLLATDDGVWVSNEYSGDVALVDVRTDQVRRRVLTRSAPRGLARSGSSIWVASATGVGAGHRGGTLTVEGNVVPGFDGIDPALTYVPSVFSMVYDGLVALRRTGGSAGLTFVPDLATALPIPTNGGRTYTFTVRKGIHYSNGAEVTAGDLRRGLLRALAVAPAYYLGVKGARACAADASRCSLDEGVVVNDELSTITFNLVRPDPDFVAKLWVHVYAIPPGVPPGRLSAPVPGTGPYMIRDYEPVTVPEARLWLTLVRNPHFQVWSYAAKPDGYPDVIRFHRERSQTQRRDDVLSGRADLTDPVFASFSSDIATVLDRQHPELVHSEPMLAMLYEWMNTRVPPFDDVRVRRALNLAVDRHRLIELSSEPGRLSVTCQVLPPNSPGYRPYCPYTYGAQPDGAYHGPDLAAARALVAASSTKGSRVTVLVDGPDDVLARYVASVLAQLGYRVKLRTADGHLANSDYRPQIGGGWWGVDYPSPADIWEPLFSCHAFLPHTDENGNRSEYCSPEVDAMAQHALDAQISDPAAARALWNAVDRRITDDAPWVAGPVTRSYVLSSPRVGNVQSNPVMGPLIDQMWVQ